MKRIGVVFLLTLFAATISAAADAAYFGKWMVNSAKSQLNDILTIEKLPSGDFRFDQVGFAYTFKLDGKEYPTPDGGTASWKALSENSWEVTNRANGKISATAKLTVNGDTISANETIPQADGKNISQTATWKRISGGPGFAGRWRPAQVDAGALWLELTPDGANGIKVAAPNSLCVAKFDGKPYPMSGSGDGPKQTMSFRKMGAASFEAITYLDGKLFFQDVCTVSADGKVLNDVGTPAATKKPLTVIFDRQ